MAKRLIVIDAQDLVNLLTVYTEGDVPLDFELQQLGGNVYLERLVGLIGSSAQWRESGINPITKQLKPLIIRYEGKKVMSWHQNPEEPYKWEKRSKKDGLN